MTPVHTKKHTQRYKGIKGGVDFFRRGLLSGSDKQIKPLNERGIRQEQMLTDESDGELFGEQFAKQGRGQRTRETEETVSREGRVVKHDVKLMDGNHYQEIFERPKKEKKIFTVQNK